MLWKLINSSRPEKRLSIDDSSFEPIVIMNRGTLNKEILFALCKQTALLVPRGVLSYSKGFQIFFEGCLFFAF